MDYLIVLLIGIAVGWLLNSFWLVIRNRWNSSKNLRSSYESTVKEIADKGKICVATVKGDIHDIGKNIVKMLLDNYG